MKYGCTYKHPPSRVVECPIGAACGDANCTRLHPLNVNGFGAVGAGFAIGQLVQARYLPNSTKWSEATIHQIRGSALTLQFNGFGDVIEVPLRRVRHLTRDSRSNSNHETVSPCFLKPNDNCLSACAPTTPPPSPSALSNLEELQRLKAVAVAREDFIVADQIKQRIAKVKKVTELEKQKQVAVRQEDFLLAMQLKQQIDEVEGNTVDPAPAITPLSTWAMKSPSAIRVM